MPESEFRVSDAEILAARGPRSAVNPERAVAALVEPERTADGRIVDIATLFLTNRECPYRCVMCDLWKSTMIGRVPVGAIPRQIDASLAGLPAAQQIKLYNSGNFFDGQAIPRADHPAIASRVQSFERVIVENHPKLCGPDCVEFAARLAGEFEIAIGLETAHPATLRALNKRMTLDDVSRAIEFLCRHEISVRAFVLLNPPFLPTELAEEWTLKSLEFAFARGTGCCTIIPARGGNGIMEQLQQQGLFSPPGLRSLERTQEAGLRLSLGRVFTDTWDLAALPGCARCAPLRQQRLHQMNLTQQIPPGISCESCDAS